MNHWDFRTDLAVIGSGAAGLAAALTASIDGLDALVIEKTGHYGGTTALSGGVLWIPGNARMQRSSADDDMERALTYLEHHVGNRVGRERLRAFVTNAPRMLDHLLRHSQLDVETFFGFPDYRPHSPGAATEDRSVEPRVFAGRRLGRHLRELRSRGPIAPAGIVGTMAELRQLASARANPGQLLKAWRTLPRNLWNRVAGRRHLTNGAALVARLRYSLLERQVPLWLNAGLSELLVEDGRIIGLRVNVDGQRRNVQARKGVVVAAGGFERNAAMRGEHLTAEPNPSYTSGSEGNTGEAIQAGLAIGAAVDLMDDAWWAPTFMPSGGAPQIVIFERAKPGNIIVDAAGQRFANEADPYNDLVKHMQEAQQAGAAAIPAYMVFDHAYRAKYPIGGMLPGITPQRHIDSGFVVRAETLSELARQAGIDADGLAATVARLNALATNGRAEDFQRGESAFDRSSADPPVA
ncbi:MAG: FAD-dependent oxidoreductase, partial [Gammaproteobacteria bacterium]|nr:FAD-dependent oxidoreductase [Gammaproteobacteria bacterium]